MKLVLWINDQPNQRALASKIAEHYKIERILVEKKRAKKKRRKLSNYIEKILEKILIPELGNSWKWLQKTYSLKYPNLPLSSVLYVDNINNKDSIKSTLEIQPDIIIVSGTRIVKEDTLNVFQKTKILNLHTGLSPYIKGGPNCTNWCISENKLELIGNSILWIDAGIDSGDLIYSNQVRFSGKESLKEIHFKVMEDAHSIYIKSIGEVTNKNPIRVRQNTIAEGTTYYNKQWTLREKLLLKFNLYRFNKNINSKEYTFKSNQITQVIPNTKNPESDN